MGEIGTGAAITVVDRCDRFHRCRVHVHRRQKREHEGEFAQQEERRLVRNRTDAEGRQERQRAKRRTQNQQAPRSGGRASLFDRTDRRQRRQAFEHNVGVADAGVAREERHRRDREPDAQDKGSDRKPGFVIPQD